MPIPVDGSGNVDGEGGTADDNVRAVQVAGPWRLVGVQPDHILRERVGSVRLQFERSLRGSGTTRPRVLGFEGADLRSAIVAALKQVAELTNDADDNGADDA